MHRITGIAVILVGAVVGAYVGLLFAGQTGLPLPLTLVGGALAGGLLGALPEAERDS